MKRTVSKFYWKILCSTLLNFVFFSHGTLRFSCRRKICFYIDFKHTQVIAPVIKLVQQYDLKHRVIFGGVSPGVNRVIAKLKVFTCDIMFDLILSLGMNKIHGASLVRLLLKSEFVDLFYFCFWQKKTKFSSWKEIQFFRNCVAYVIFLTGFHRFVTLCFDAQDAKIYVPTISARVCSMSVFGQCLCFTVSYGSFKNDAADILCAAEGDGGRDSMFRQSRIFGVKCII